MPYLVSTKSGQFKDRTQKINKNNNKIKAFLPEFQNDKIMRGENRAIAFPLRCIPEFYRISILKEDPAKTRHIKRDTFQERHAEQ